MKKMIKVVRNYEGCSGQLIKNNKSSLYVHNKTPLSVCNIIKMRTRMRKGTFPFTYLGCPIYYGRKKIAYFEDLINKVMKRVMSWQNKLLSFGGRYVLIAHVLQSIPVYLLSVMNPPARVIEQIHKIFARFFWGNTTNNKRRHWVAWDKLCLAKVEGGLGFRSLYDTSNALFGKLWWNFRTSTAMWSTYMGNKYCKKLHPVIAQAKGASQVWKKMVKVRENMEHLIWWQIKSGNSSFWFDNWIKHGALYFVDNDQDLEEDIEVKKFIIDGAWDIQRLKTILSEDMVQHITENVSPHLLDVDNDKAWWMGDTSGNFTVKSAWEIFRKKQEQSKLYDYMWPKGLPTKICFFLWRTWIRKIPIDDNLKRIKISVVSRCWCCDDYNEETINHLFLTSPIARKLWRQFAICAGLHIEGLQLHQVILKWWTSKQPPKLRIIFWAILAIIMWEIWKRRNTRKHGGNTTYGRMAYQVQMTINQLIKVNYPWFTAVPTDWPSVIQYMTEYKPRLYHCLVSWKKPDIGRVKVNTDGASHGNPGLSTYGYCVRDDKGDLIYAQAGQLGITTSIVAETTAVYKAIKYCYTQGFNNVSLETDSLFLKNILTDVWKTPWEVIQLVETTKRWMYQIVVETTHTFREGNKLADYITNLPMNKRGLCSSTVFRKSQPWENN